MKHIVKWTAMPYDIDKGGAYYALLCYACYKQFAETFIPSFHAPFLYDDGCEADQEGRERAISMLLPGDDNEIISPK